MTGAAITIRRQIVSVDLRGTEADGLALQHRLPAVCAEVIAPALESALGRFDTGPESLVIERLEIDVPTLALEALASGLAAGVHRGVEECLLRAPPQAGAPGASGDDAGSGVIERRSVAETVDDALAAFLATGRLPWSYRLPPGRPLEQAVTDAWADGEPPPAVRPRLLRVLAAPDARLRLWLQFSRAFALGVLRAVAPPLAAGLDEVLHTLGEVAEGPRPSAEAREGLAGRLIAAALADDPAGYRPTARELVRRALLTPSAMPAPPSPGEELVALLEHHWPGITGDGAVLVGGSAPGRPGGAGATDPGTPSTASEPPGRAGIGSAPAATRAPSTRIENPSAGTAAASTRIEAAPVGIEGASEGIMVANAGVVLLHPFLPRLFEGLGLAAGDELPDPSRAIGLLHHLATGELTTPEHEVTLAKVLCGRPLDEPVPADVRLTVAETGEATTLLRAVIGHWTALRDTAPDVLRLEFLRRPGILSGADFDEWLLRVDTGTADILLDRLPWSTSMIRLPWMPRMLHVEWR